MYLPALIFIGGLAVINKSAEAQAVHPRLRHIARRIDHEKLLARQQTVASLLSSASVERSPDESYSTAEFSSLAATSSTNLASPVAVDDSALASSYSSYNFPTHSVASGSSDIAAPPIPLSTSSSIAVSRQPLSAGQTSSDPATSLPDSAGNSESRSPLSSGTGSSETGSLITTDLLTNSIATTLDTTSSFSSTLANGTVGPNPNNPKLNSYVTNTAHASSSSPSVDISSSLTPSSGSSLPPDVIYSDTSIAGSFASSSDSAPTLTVPTASTITDASPSPIATLVTSNGVELSASEVLSVVTASSVVVVVADGMTSSSTTDVQSTSTHLVYVTAGGDDDSTSSSVSGIGAVASTSAASRLELGTLVAIAAVIIGVLLM
ncbi:MAG: hypothetical protein CYPHOPRED_001667 [Cyphobasidiales sp. Tagirdzhanova-0007]|nr:MAG: hypothetical protein CYPHOPRED_001667 [Cyphobasidiales sp. Tagirdzhanova-0007]